MQRTTRLDGTRETAYSPVQFVRDPRGLTADELLKMRETGMTNSAIARAVNSKAYYVEKLIGKTPSEILRKAQSEGGKRGKGVRKKETNAVQYKLATDLPAAYGKLKPHIGLLYLEGEVCEFHVIPEHKTVDVMWSGTGRSLGSIGFDVLESFIEELMDVFAVVKDSRVYAGNAHE